MKQTEKSFGSIYFDYKAEIRNQELYVHQRMKALNLVSVLSSSVLCYSTTPHLSLVFLIYYAQGSLVLLFTFQFFTHCSCTGFVFVCSLTCQEDMLFIHIINAPPVISYCLTLHYTLVGVIFISATWKIFIFFPLPNYCFPFAITFGLSPPRLCRWRWGRVV